MAAFATSPSPEDESPLAAASNILVLPLHVTEEPTTLQIAGSSPIQLDQSSLSGADESLADLQPDPVEEEGERRSGWDDLLDEQQKLEFMAALGLVPPAVLEEIHRRQNTCKTEYGNWWDRLHSTDFCLVPKSDSSLHSLHNLNCEGSEDGMGETVMGDYSEVGRGADGEVMTQVAPRPDAGALVEQITYLTSWPQTTPPDTANSVEIITQPSAGHVSDGNDVMTGSTDEGVITQSLGDHYAGILTDQDQINEQQLQSAFQHIATTYR